MDNCDMQMQRQIDELEAEAAQIADVSEEAAVEYHRLRQVFTLILLHRLPVLLTACGASAGLGCQACCSLLQDIRQQEAVILQAMLRPEKLLHFLRPGRLVRRA
jgi:rRNA-processing arch domain